MQEIRYLSKDCNSYFISVQYMLPLTWRFSFCQFCFGWPSPIVFWIAFYLDERAPFSKKRYTQKNYTYSFQSGQKDVSTNTRLDGQSDRLQNWSIIIVKSSYDYACPNYFKSTVLRLNDTTSFTKYLFHVHQTLVIRPHTSVFSHQT